MPTFTFRCKKCRYDYDVLVAYDPSGKYKDVKCEVCGSKKKEKLMNAPLVTNHGTFSYQAGKNMTKAKNERRAAEAASHMGTDPYNAPGLPNLENIDLNMGEGVHHPFPLKG